MTRRRTMLVIAFLGLLLALPGQALAEGEDVNPVYPPVSNSPVVQVTVAKPQSGPPAYVEILFVRSNNCIVKHPGDPVLPGDPVIPPNPIQPCGSP